MKQNHILLCALLFICASAQAYDESSTVFFDVTGTIDAVSCNVAVLPSDNINLGTIGTQYLKGIPGGNGPYTLVSLQFSGCTDNIASATITFSGDPYDATYTMIYKNKISGESAAGGVGLQLFTSTEGGQTFAPLGNGDAYEFPFIKDADSNTFKMIARLYTPYGDVTGGQFSTTVTFNVSYK